MYFTFHGSEQEKQIYFFSRPTKAELGFKLKNIKILIMHLRYPFSCFFFLVFDQVRYSPAKNWKVQPHSLTLLHSLSLGSNLIRSVKIFFFYKNFIHIIRKSSSNGFCRGLIWASHGALMISQSSKRVSGTMEIKKEVTKTQYQKVFWKIIVM